MDIRQPTEKEMIEGIAKGFYNILSVEQYSKSSPLNTDNIWEAIRLGVRDAFDEKDILKLLKGKNK